MERNSKGDVAFVPYLCTYVYACIRSKMFCVGYYSRISCLRGIRSRFDIDIEGGMEEDFRMFCPVVIRLIIDIFRNGWLIMISFRKRRAFLIISSCFLLDLIRIATREADIRLDETLFYTDFCFWLNYVHMFVFEQF